MFEAWGPWQDCHKQWLTATLSTWHSNLCIVMSHIKLSNLRWETSRIVHASLCLFMYEAVIGPHRCTGPLKAHISSRHNQLCLDHICTPLLKVLLTVIPAPRRRRVSTDQLAQAACFIPHMVAAINWLRSERTLFHQSGPIVTLPC